MLIVDAANVVGSRPDGWWRDRAGAAARLVTAVVAAVEAGVLRGPVVVVLEGAARRGVAAGTVGAGGSVEVVHASGSGDDRLACLAAEAMAAASVLPVGPIPADAVPGVPGQALGGPSVEVVTADRELGRRVSASGARVLGPQWLLDRLSAGGNDPRRPG